MMVFRIARDHRPEFVMWRLNCGATYQQALQDVMGATAPHINISTIRNYYLALPSAEEQELIIRHINSTTGPIDIAIARVGREVALLREYRARLAADVVTGKLDVRVAAEGIPRESMPREVTAEDVKLFDREQATEEEAIA
jgi:type I restriction enzyme S subunit